MSHRLGRTVEEQETATVQDRNKEVIQEIGRSDFYSQYVGILL
jgi:hypothetical protein